MKIGWGILLILLMKCLIIWTGHIQEDAFITWRVAENFVENGVLGFNKGIKVSASTTHLYTFLSSGVRFLFGKCFIIPLIFINSFLFLLGSYFMLLVFFSSRNKLFLIALAAINLSPPALQASSLGMEYGLLFFLYGAFIYYVDDKKKTWAMVLLPILIIWTRLDGAIFLGVSFLGLLFLDRKWYWSLVLGIIIGLLSFLAFNYFYFGSIINHTIYAKRIAYEVNIWQHDLIGDLKYWGLYGGIFRNLSWLGVLSSALLLIGALWASIFIVRHFKKDTTVTWIIFTFAVVKIALFLFLKAYFDWYFWIPRVFLVSLIVIGFLKSSLWQVPAMRYVFSFSVFFLFLFQLWQSYGISYLETRHRDKIGKDLNEMESDKNQYIFLEPAGRIPFYSGLNTIDEVGLVDKKVTSEMEIDKKNFYVNTINKYKPKYILALSNKIESPNYLYLMDSAQKKMILSHYQFIRAYQVDPIVKESPFITQLLYKVKIPGKDYFLYRRTD